MNIRFIAKLYQALISERTGKNALKGVPEGWPPYILVDINFLVIYKKKINYISITFTENSRICLPPTVLRFTILWVSLCKGR